MRRLGAAAALVLGGCSITQFYFEQTEGISPSKLVPLYFQEKQYVEDRALVARVQGALAAEPALRDVAIEVDAYAGEVALGGARATAEQTQKAVEVAQSVFGVKSVTVRPQ